MGLARRHIQLLFSGNKWEIIQITKSQSQVTWYISHLQKWDFLVRIYSLCNKMSFTISPKIKAPDLKFSRCRNRETRRVVSCRATPSKEDSRVLGDADWGIRLLTRWVFSGSRVNLWMFSSFKSMNVFLVYLLVHV